MRRRSTVAIVVTAILAAGLLGACRRVERAPAGPVGDEGPAVLARMHQQAAEALARFDAAYAAAKQPVFLPLRAFQPDVVGAAPGENGKEILDDRRLVLDGPVPYEVPAGALLTWPSGATRPIVALTATQAFDAMASQTTANCHCTPEKQVHVIGARLTTVSVDTVDGPVTAPAWDFTLAGYIAHLVMVAVGPDEAMIPPDGPWDSGNPPVGQSIERATSTSDGLKLTVGFTGSPGPATGPCGVDYSAEAVFGAHAVVVILHAHPYQGPGAGAMCPQMGYPREADVPLSQPLGNRVLLEGRVGHPIPVLKT